MEKDRDIEEKEMWELGLKAARHRDTEGEKERNAEAERRQREGGGEKDTETGRQTLSKVSQSINQKMKLTATQAKLYCK